MKKIFTAIVIVILSSPNVSAADSTSVALPIGSSFKIASLKIFDNVTGTPITGTISNLVIQNNNPQVALVDTATGTSIKVTRVSEGTGTAVVSCHVVYTDPGDGLQKSEDKTILITYTVIGAPHGVKLSLAFN